VLRGEIAGIAWITPEVSFSHHFQTGRFDLTAQHCLVDAMESFADRRNRVSLSGGDVIAAPGLDALSA
jgi:hypothetical protein